MTLLDANAFVAVLRREPGAMEVAELLRNGECATPAPCVAEVVDKLVRRHGIAVGDLAERLGPLLEGSIAVLAVDSQIAWRAGEIRAAHYHRKTSALSLADCVLLAAAGPDDEIATSDRAVATAAHRLGIGLIPLLDSNGERPPVE
ncbi:MAG: PIN domain-containing protein [Chloroflexota bacterium]